MLYAALTHTSEELQQVLRLQKENLIGNIDDAEMRSQGFVTLRHTYPVLEQMHQLAPSVLIKDDETVVGYALTMLRECRQLMPDLEPMFSLLDTIYWKNKLLTDYRFYVMGQICIDRQYRGQGLFDKLYQYHKEIYQTRFDLFITEISTRNHRSIRAHERVGFKTIHTHRDELDEWIVVGWDWS